MTDERNDGLHPKHPGRGKCAVIELESESGEPEIGGFVIFLPTGATKTVHWRSAKHITPTLEAAEEYVAKVVDSLLRQHNGHRGHPDIGGVNWTSVAAAVQRVIMDWNDKLSKAINAKMLRDSIDGKTVNVPAGADRRRLH